MHSYISEIDTKRFGFKIAKVDDFGHGNPLSGGVPPKRRSITSDEIVEELIGNLKIKGVRLIISKIDLSNLPLINLLEKNGFEFKDIQVTYKFDLGNETLGNINLSNNCDIRIATSADLDSLICIAEESFYGYGHYFADKRLDPQKCTEIYKDWITRSVYDKKIADIVVVAEIDHDIAGFLSVKLYKNDHYYAAGVQGAVTSKYRNKSIFRSINLHCIEWGRGLGLEWIENNVILTNFPVNYSYSKIGFKISRSFGTFHGWLD